MTLRPSDPEKRREAQRRWREGQRRAARRYEDRVREEVLAGERDWSSIPPVNSDRKERLYERNFGDKAAWIRSLPCDTCGEPPPSDPSHYPKRGMGGCGGSKRDLFPQCRECHDFLEEHLEEFKAEHGDPRERTAHYEERWQALQEAA